jgi:hypothetical protein
VERTPLNALEYSSRFQEPRCSRISEPDSQPLQLFRACDDVLGRRRVLDRRRTR